MDVELRISYFTFIHRAAIAFNRKNKKSAGGILVIGSDTKNQENSPRNIRRVKSKSILILFFKEHFLEGVYLNYIFKINFNEK